MFISTVSSIYWLLVDRRFSVSKWKTFDLIFAIWPLVCKFSSVKLQDLTEITFSLRRNASCLSYDSVSPHCTWLGLLSILQVSCLFYWHCSSSNPTSCELQVLEFVDGKELVCTVQLNWLHIMQGKSCCCGTQWYMHILVQSSTNPSVYLKESCYLPISCWCYHAYQLSVYIYQWLSKWCSFFGLKWHIFGGIQVSFVFIFR